MKEQIELFRGKESLVEQNRFFNRELLKSSADDENSYEGENILGNHDFINPILPIKEKTDKEYLMEKISLVESVKPEAVMMFFNVITFPELFKEKEVLRIIENNIKNSKIEEKEELIQIGQEILSVRNQKII